MASQPTRPRFRLPTLARLAPAPAPAPAPTLTPAPPPPQPRPPFIRPTFRPITQPQPPPSPPPEPTAAVVPTRPPVTTLPPPPPIATPAPPPPSVIAPPPPSPPPAKIVDAVPSSPPKQIVAFPTSSVPSSPQKPAPPSSPVPPKPSPTSPIQSSASPKPASTTSIEPIPTTVARPPPQQQELFPRTIKPAVQTPPPSPYIPKPTAAAPLPSSLVLPPPQLIKPEPDQARIPPEAEQKTVVDQKQPSKPWQDGSDSERPFPETRKPGFAEDRHRKKVSSDSEEGGMRVITIAGENIGAFMEVIRSPSKGTPSNHEEGSGWNGGEEKANKSSLGKAHQARGIESPPTPTMKAFMNSNVQGVNNSMVFNSAYNHHDPGVHLSFSRKPAVGGTPRAGFHHLNQEEPGSNGCQS